MNDRNPYTPPLAPVSDVSEPLAAVRKPVSIWLLQIVCGLITLLLSIGVPATVAKLRVAAGLALVANTIAFSLQLLFVSLIVGAIIASQRRSRIGRWLGVFVMGSCVALVVLVGFQSRYEGEDSLVMIAGQILGTVLFMTPFALLIYFPAFSKRARAWYGK